eukprot:UN21131
MLYNLFPCIINITPDTHTCRLATTDCLSNDVYV